MTSSSELNMRRRHSHARMPKLFVFWSTKKQLGRNRRWYKQSTSEPDLYSNSPNKHKQDKTRLVHRERGYKDTQDPRQGQFQLHKLHTYLDYMAKAQWHRHFPMGFPNCPHLREHPMQLLTCPSRATFLWLLILELNHSYEELKAICLQQTILKRKICFAAQQNPSYLIDLKLIETVTFFARVDLIADVRQQWFSLHLPEVTIVH